MDHHLVERLRSSQAFEELREAPGIGELTEEFLAQLEHVETRREEGARVVVLKHVENGGNDDEPHPYRKVTLEGAFAEGDLSWATLSEDVHLGRHAGDSVTYEYRDGDVTLERHLIS